MERKRPKGIKKSATAPLAIIPVDGTRIRQKIKREYEKVRRDLDAARADLERFEREDAPAFSRWIDHQFGALIAELGQTTRRLQELENLLADVEAEMFYSGASERQAYARVMNRQKNAQPSPEAGEEEEADSQEDGRDGKHRSSGFQQDFEDQQPGWESFFGSGKEKNGPMGRKPANPTARLKELYRALARRLHPDAQKEMTAKKREWWHQAQTAYETGDIEQLEIILNLCEIEEAGTTQNTSLSLLQRISAQLKKSLRQVKNQLAKYRRDQAWNFTQRPDRKELESRMRRQFNHDLRLLKEELQTMELQMAALAARPAQRRSSPRLRRARVYDPFEFFF